MSNLDIKFFPSQDPTSSRRGGGFITCGALKTNFSVFNSTKSKYGFTVSLPYRKGTDGKIVNEVTFTSQAVSEEVHKFIQEQLGGSSPSDEPTPRIVKESIGGNSGERPTSVDVRAKVQKFGKGSAVPF